MIQLWQIHEYGSERQKNYPVLSLKYLLTTAALQLHKQENIYRFWKYRVEKFWSCCLVLYWVISSEDHRTRVTNLYRVCAATTVTKATAPVSICSFLRGRSHFSLDPVCGRLVLPAWASSCLVVGWGSVLRHDQEGMAGNQMCCPQLDNEYWQKTLRSPLIFFFPSTEHIQAGAALLAWSCSPDEVEWAPGFKQ